MGLTRILGLGGLTHVCQTDPKLVNNGVSTRISASLTRFR